MSRLFLFIFFVMPGVLCAEVFKCVDGGKTIYSVTPCGVGSVPYANVVSVRSGSRTASFSRGASGMFFIDGSVNGSAVSFLVDTGATRTLLSGPLAVRLGVKSCIPAGSITTVNGVVSQCSISVNNLTIGGFDFSNVTLRVVPSMADGALLGNDFLSKFVVVQRGDELTLSR